MHVYIVLGAHCICLVQSSIHALRVCKWIKKDEKKIQEKEWKNSRQLKYLQNMKEVYIHAYYSYELHIQDACNIKYVNIYIIHTDIHTCIHIYTHTPTYLHV